MKDLRVYLRSFVREHPHGWNDEDWVRLLGDLEEAGVDVSDPDGIGLALESTRLRYRLEDAEVRGIGPKRIDRIVDSFGTIYNVRSAGPDAVAALPSFYPALGREVVAVL